MTPWAADSVEADLATRTAPGPSGPHAAEDFVAGNIFVMEGRADMTDQHCVEYVLRVAMHDLACSRQGPIQGNPPRDLKQPKKGCRSGACSDRYIAAYGHYKSNAVQDGVAASGSGFVQLGHCAGKGRRWMRQPPSQAQYCQQKNREAKGLVQCRDGVLAAAYVEVFDRQAGTDGGQYARGNGPMQCNSDTVVCGHALFRYAGAIVALAF